MVLRACRRALRDRARRGGRLPGHVPRPGPQGGFAPRRGVAGPLAPRRGLPRRGLRRGARARRRAHERRAAEAASPTLAAPDAGRDDLGRVLHEEIGRLPATFRAAVVLCDLEGLTQEQAAQRLGWPSGTVRSRLARGRGRLQARLTRRGLAPTTGALAAFLTADAAGAGVPSALAEATVRAATGRIAAGTGPAAALSEGVLKAMFLTKLKWAAAAALAIGIGAGGPAVLALQPAGGPPGGPSAAAEAGSGPGSAGALGLPEAEASPGPEPTIEDPRAPISMAELDMKVAEDRLEWSNRMLQKGYVSLSENLDDKRAVEEARLALEQARNEQSGASAQDPPEVIDARISLAEFDLRRAEDRLEWAKRMVEKGYYSRSQMLDDEQAVMRARDALELARKGERKRDEVAFLTREIERVKAELQDAIRRWQ